MECGNLRQLVLANGSCYVSSFLFFIVERDLCLCIRLLFCAFVILLLDSISCGAPWCYFSKIQYRSFDCWNEDWSVYDSWSSKAATKLSWTETDNSLHSEMQHHIGIFFTIIVFYFQDKFLRTVSSFWANVYIYRCDRYFVESKIISSSLLEHSFVCSTG